MRIPITFTHAEQIENPQYVANNDVNLDEAAIKARNQAYQSAISNGLPVEEANRLAQNAETSVRNRSQIMRISDNWALTQLKLGIPINHWLINQTLNALTMVIRIHRIFERSPIYEQRFNWIWKIEFTT